MLLSGSPSHENVSVVAECLAEKIPGKRSVLGGVTGHATAVSGSSGASSVTSCVAPSKNVGVCA